MIKKWFFSLFLIIVQIFFFLNVSLAFEPENYNNAEKMLSPPMFIGRVLILRSLEK